MRIEGLEVGDFGVNCFILWDESGQATVIDPGAEAGRVADRIRANELTVAAYMLTHGHVDHVSALAELWEAHPAPIGLHAADAEWAFAPGNAMPPFYPAPRSPGSIERALADGQNWNDGGLACRVIETPGHTPGSVCFFFPAHSALFSGDTLFAGSVGRTDLPGGNARQLGVSLQAIAALPDSVAVYPGHGPATDIRTEKATNFFLRSPGL